MGILADGPGGHHHGAHHGDHHGAHGAHHGAHNADHGHGAAAHHADHGAAAHHPVQHTVVSSNPVQHHTVHSSGTVQQRPVSASFSIQPEAHPIQHSVSQGPQNLAQLIATHPKLTTLNAAVKAAGLEATLASPGPFKDSSETHGSWHQDAGQEHPSGYHQPQDSCRGTDFGLKGQIHSDQVQGWKRIHCSF